MGCCGRVELGSLAEIDDRPASLRHLDIDPHLLDVGDLEPARAPVPEAGIDQCAEIGLARGDDAVEGRADALEILQRHQQRTGHWPPAASTAARLDCASLAFSSASCWETASFLTSDCQRLLVTSARLSPDCAAARSALAWFSCWSRSGVSISASNLPGLHMGADILLPVLQIAVDPSIDRRLVEGLDIAGQGERLGLGAAFRHDDGDGGRRLRLGRPGQAGLIHHPRADAKRSDRDGGSAGDKSDPLQAAQRELLSSTRHGFSGG